MSIPKNKSVIPSICNILFCYKEEIQSLTDGWDAFHKKIILNVGSTWKGIYFTKGSADFSEQEKSEDSGQTFTQSLKFLFPGESDLNSAIFDSISNRPVVVLAVYDFGKAKILGDTVIPAKFVNTVQNNTKSCGRMMELQCLAITTAKWLDPSQAIPIANEDESGEQQQ